MLLHVGFVLEKGLARLEKGIFDAMGTGYIMDCGGTLGRLDMHIY